MKKVIYFFALFIIVALSGCQKDDIDFTSNNDQIPQLTEKERIAAEEALCFANDLSLSTRSTSGVGTYKLSTVIPWPDSDIKNATRSSISSLSDTALYIVNFTDENGYALVKVDDDESLVVAFVEQGNLFPNSDIDNPGMRLFLNQLDAFFKLDTVITNPPISYILTDPHPNDPPAAQWRITTHYPALLHTQWGQDEPFNDLCFTSDSVKAKAGCVAIALGQIFSAHQFPQSYNGHNYNWNTILNYMFRPVPVPQYNSGKTSVAYLIHDIGLLVEMSYGQNSSGAYFYNVPQCFNAFGYSYQVRYSYDFNTCLDNIAEGKPVYIRGVSNYGGHAWVIDGILVRVDTTIQGYDNEGNIIYPEEEKYVHCNWGWYGSGNGYFLSGVFDLSQPAFGGTPGTGNFSSDNYLYYDIEVDE